VIWRSCCFPVRYSINPPTAGHLLEYSRDSSVDIVTGSAGHLLEYSRDSSVDIVTGSAGHLLEYGRDSSVDIVTGCAGHLLEYGRDSSVDIVTGSAGHLLEYGRDSSVDIVTGYRMEGRGIGSSVSVRAKRFFCRPSRPEQSWCPALSLIRWVPGSWHLSTSQHVALRLIIRGTITPPHHTPSWCGV
jgi:hypothetical protein